MARIHCTSKSGLSPRVRGNPRRRQGPLASTRSIPACAGEPQAERTAYRPLEVYPRVCGGTTVSDLGEHHSRRKGLSPRVRGNLLESDGSQDTIKEEVYPRVCGGTFCLRYRRCRHWQVYPRVCGGTRCRRSYTSPQNGLSSRVRGNPRPIGPYRTGRRSIPACAGEPRPSSMSCMPCRRGSIPACAGEPRPQTKHTHMRKVYPRVCGGTYGVGRVQLHSGTVYPRVCGGTHRH